MLSFSISSPDLINKTSFLCGPHSKRGIGGEKRPKYGVKTG